MPHRIDGEHGDIGAQIEGLKMLLQRWPLIPSHSNIAAFALLRLSDV